MNTKAVEDYLKAIYALIERHGQASTSAIAERLDVTAASVTGMLKKLGEMNLVRYQPYKPITLTRAGDRQNGIFSQKSRNRGSNFSFNHSKN